MPQFRFFSVTYHRCWLCESPENSIFSKILELTIICDVIVASRCRLAKSLGIGSILGCCTTYNQVVLSVTSLLSGLSITSKFLVRGRLNEWPVNVTESARHPRPKRLKHLLLLSLLVIFDKFFRWNSSLDYNFFDSPSLFAIVLQVGRRCRLLANRHFLTWAFREATSSNFKFSSHFSNEQNDYRLNSQLSCSPSGPELVWLWEMLASGWGTL